jgi:hypothetical protein
MKQFTCCICGKKETGWGNNPDPITDEAGQFFDKDAQCCEECNSKIVISKRYADLLRFKR